MKFIAIIPARYASSRFPGKPLAKIGGREMILRVCDRVTEAGVECAVATDDRRIFNCVSEAGYTAVMTSGECVNGTERVEEAYRNLGSDAEIIINVQGDEPFIRPEQIELLKSVFSDHPDTPIATLVKRYDPAGGIGGLEDPNLVKVVRSYTGEALYFSRSVIPYVRNTEREKWLKTTQFHTHTGIYAYQADVLKEIVKLPVSPLEKAESLEQLRWLQNGYRIMTAVTVHETVGIDTPADLEEAEKKLDDME